MFPASGTIQSSILSAVAVAVSIAENEPFLATVCSATLLASLCLQVLSVNWKTNEPACYLAGVLTLIITVAMIYCIDIKDTTATNEYLTYHLLGGLIWAFLFPTGFMFLSQLAIAFNGSYNRILIGSFSGFISMALLSFQWVIMSVFFESKVDTEYPFAMELSYLFVNTVLSFAQSFIIAKMFKRKQIRLIREEREG